MQGKFCYDYPRPMVTVDAVVLCLDEEHLFVLLIRRLNEPFKDLWALPGGFIEMNEELKKSALRELKEETGIEHHDLFQILTVGTLNRDPRGRTISVVYAGFLTERVCPARGDDAKEARWFPVTKLPDMAFDHNQVLKDVFAKLIEPEGLNKIVDKHNLFRKIESVMKNFLSA